MTSTRRFKRTSTFFVAGGTLRPSVRSYVTRPADSELLDAVLNSDYCYVLTPRQMGKSSLMVRTAKRLGKEGVNTAIIDLTEIGVIGIDPWYLGLLNDLQRAFRLEVDIEKWWEDHSHLGRPQRFRDFLIDEVLPTVKGQIAIFIDEIDSTLKLDFRDDFFAAIRALYNRRADDPKLKRLTFVLLGVASPAELIKDSTRTPFNIGQEINLQEFEPHDARILLEGLQNVFPAQGEEVFNHIFHWTHGHPYLTQKLCLSVIEQPTEYNSPAKIDKLVHTLFIADEARNEANIQFVNDKILNDPRKNKLIKLYRTVYEGKRVTEVRQSPEQTHLKLSGLVKAEQGQLKVRNHVYKQAFDKQWIREHTAINWQNYAIALLIIIVLTGLIVTFRDRNLENEANEFENRIMSHTDDGQTQAEALKNLFELEPWLANVDYSRRAYEQFYDLESLEAQSAIFDAHLSNDDMEFLVKKLYVTLADLENSEDNAFLLEKMCNALPEESDLYKEIGFWLNAKEAEPCTTADSCPALSSYENAISINDRNPATLYERATYYIMLEDFESALKDLEKVLAIAAESPVASEDSESITSVTTTISPTVTVTPSRIATVTMPPAATSVSTLDPSATSVASQPTPVPELPTTSAPPSVVRSRFRMRGEIETAVRSLFEKHPELHVVLATDNGEQFTNLLAQIPTATPAVEGDTGTAVAVQTTATHIAVEETAVFATSLALTAVSTGDADEDGLNDSAEASLGTDPNNPDTDGDGLRDGDEVLVYSSDPNNSDTDGDLLPDGEEVNIYNTDPTNLDTDGDGVPDATEITLGTEPLIVEAPTPEPLAETPTPEPSVDTPTPEPSVDTPTPEPSTEIPTATPDSPFAEPNVHSVSCFAGPGAEYGAIEFLFAGTPVPIVEQDRRGDWWIVQIPNGRTCWTDRGFQTVSGSTEDLPIAAYPPTPTN